MNTRIDIRIVRVSNYWVLGLYGKGDKEPYHYKEYLHKKTLLVDMGRILEELEAIEVQEFEVDILSFLDFKKEDEDNVL